MRSSTTHTSRQRTYTAQPAPVKVLSPKPAGAPRNATTGCSIIETGFFLMLRLIVFEPSFPIRQRKAHTPR
jgi:hypothetical protein